MGIFFGVFIQKVFFRVDFCSRFSQFEPDELEIFRLKFTKKDK
jgi:hypothetical protein